MKIDMVFIIVVIIITLLTIRGAHRGILGLVLGVLGWVFALGFVSWMTPHMEDYLGNSTYKEWVYAQVEEYIQQTVDEQVIDRNNDLEQLVNGWQLPMIAELIGAVQDETNQQIEGTKAKIVATITEEITNQIVRASAMLICMALALIVVLLLSLVRHAIHEIPIVGGISRAIGGVWGFFEGVLAVWAFFILVACMSTTELGQKLLLSIMNNPILLFLYRNNLIVGAVDQIRNAIGG